MGALVDYQCGEEIIGISAGYFRRNMPEGKIPGKAELFTETYVFLANLGGVPFKLFITGNTFGQFRIFPAEGGQLTNGKNRTGNKGRNFVYRSASAGKKGKPHVLKIDNKTPGREKKNRKRNQH
jgi:hypothetical protein